MGQFDVSKTIRKIIESEELLDKEFEVYQTERLKYLESLHTKPLEEQETERQLIISKYKSIGILDENGKLSEFYRLEKN